MDHLHTKRVVNKQKKAPKKQNVCIKIPLTDGDYKHKNCLYVLKKCPTNILKYVQNQPWSSFLYT